MLDGAYAYQAFTFQKDVIFEIPDEYDGFEYLLEFLYDGENKNPFRPHEFLKMVAVMRLMGIIWTEKVEKMVVLNMKDFQGKTSVAFYAQLVNEVHSLYLLVPKGQPKQMQEDAESITDDFDLEVPPPAQSSVSTFQRFTFECVYLLCSRTDTTSKAFGQRLIVLRNSVLF
jgi:hypothetical protein